VCDWNTRARKRADRKVLGEILHGVSDRFYATLRILIRVRLETPVTLQEQFQNGNLDLYWTLTALILIPEVSIRNRF
jgi:hypothetical protein